MKCNVGPMDRIIRIIIGVVILAAGFYYKSIWGVIGFITLLTGIFGTCLLYMPFGISTCKAKK